MTSDIQSDDGDHHPKKRLKIRPRRLIESEDDEPEETTLTPRPPKITMKGIILKQFI